MKLLNVALASTLMMLVVGCGEGTPNKAAGTLSSQPVTEGQSGGLGTATPVDKDKEMPAEATPTAPGTSAETTAAVAPFPELPNPPDLAPVALVDGVAELTPGNSKIQFVGTHSGDKPDPRLGGFEKFTGKLKAADGKLKVLSFAIDTDSLWTEIGDKLTGHLKSPDFFDTKEFPEIKFESTKIVESEPGILVTGLLTLHGETNEVTVPAKAKFGDDTVTVVAEFLLDRTTFKMTYGEGKVEKDVKVTVIIGEKTQPTTAPAN